MFKRRRVKKDFDVALAEGDDAKIEQLVRENPWLQDYVEDVSEETDLAMKRTCAAIGIMEDELNMPVPVDEIAYSLEMDFSSAVPVSKVEQACIELEAKGFVKRQLQGYVLTVEGGRVCDKFLNKQAAEVAGDLPGYHA